jgi:hypothetical protein
MQQPRQMPGHHLCLALTRSPNGCCSFNGAAPYNRSRPNLVLVRRPKRCSRQRGLARNRLPVLQPSRIPMATPRIPPTTPWTQAPPGRPATDRLPLRQPSRIPLAAPSTPPITPWTAAPTTPPATAAVASPTRDVASLARELLDGRGWVISGSAPGRDSHCAGLRRSSMPFCKSRRDQPVREPEYDHEPY